MSNEQLLAAARIVELQDEVVEAFLGPLRTANVFAEQREIWDEYFLGQPYEHILGLTRLPGPSGA